MKNNNSKLPPKADLSPRLMSHGFKSRAEKFAIVFSIIFFGVLFFVKDSWAATYYMATNGSDNNSGSLSSPWATLNYSQSRLSPGDTLYIKGGVYHNQRVAYSFVSGTAGARITISGAPDEQAIFDGDNTTKGLLYDLSNSSYITFKDFEIRNYPAQLLYLLNNCHYWIFENLYMHDIGTTDVFGGIFVSGIIIDNSTHNIIRNSRGEKLGYNEWQHHWVYFGNGASYNEVYNNFFKDAISAGIHSYHTPAGHHNKMYNNVIIGGHWGWVNGNGEEYDEFYNNTLYNNEYGLDVRGANNIIRNNIISNWSSNSIVSGNTLDHNLWYPNWTGKGSGDITGNPLFVNPATDNFHLQSGSPAINAGATISLVTQDYDGVSRPQGTAYDIGAYEYASGTTPPLDTTPPAAPTGVRVQ